MYTKSLIIALTSFLAGLSFFHFPISFAQSHASVAPKSVVSMLHVNHADPKSLITMKGIGRKRAAAIVQYRQKHGEFKNWQALSKVPGLSTKTVTRILQKNKNHIAL